MLSNEAIEILGQYFEGKEEPRYLVDYIREGLIDPRAVKTWLHKHAAELRTSAHQTKDTEERELLLADARRAERAAGQL